MPRRRRSSYEHGHELNSAASLASPQHASRRSTRASSNAPGPPPPRPPRVDRRPSPHTFVSEPPRLHVSETLSAEAATWLMLEKWDLMDEAGVELEENEQEREGRRDRRRGGRSRSMPARADRTVSRLTEYELWQPERERIRLAQVEMERREDEAKARVELAEAQAQQQQSVVVDEPVVEKKKVRDRKATPRLSVSAPVSDEDEDDEWRSSGRSATTSMAPTESSPQILDDLDEAPWPSREELARRWEPVRAAADLGRSPSTTSSRAAGASSPRVAPALALISPPSATALSYNFSPACAVPIHLRVNP